MCGHEVIGYVGEAGTALQRPHLGLIEDIPRLREHYDAVFVAFGATDRKKTKRRSKVVADLELLCIPTMPLISPHAVISHGAIVGDGAFIAHGVVISVDATIGSHAIKNSNAIIDHDTVIGNNTIIAPDMLIGANAKIGQVSLIGTVYLVFEGRKISQDVIIGLGATVVRDIPMGCNIIPLCLRVMRKNK